MTLASIGDGCHGYEFAIDPALIDTDENMLVTIQTASSFGSQLIGTIEAGLSAKPILQQPQTEDLTALADRPSRIPDKPRSHPLASLEAAKPSSEEKSVLPPIKPTSSLQEALAIATKLEQARNLPAAIDQLHSILRLDERNFDALFRLGRVYLATGEIKQAREFALEALNVRPNHFKPSIVLARLAELDGQRLLALEYWRRVPPTDSAYLERLLRSARILTAMERPAQALSTIHEAIEFRNGDVRPRRALAELLQGLGDRDKALAAWLTVEELTPDDNSVTRRIEAIRTSTRDSQAWLNIQRFRHAMKRQDRPVLLATGSDLISLIGAQVITRELYRHFEVPIELVVPNSPAVRSPFIGTFVRDIMISGIDEIEGEVIFILPEFLIGCKDEFKPDVGISHSFIDQQHTPELSLGLRYNSYLSWISGLLGLAKVTGIAYENSVSDFGAIDTYFTSNNDFRLTAITELDQLSLTMSHFSVSCPPGLDDLEFLSERVSEISIILTDNEIIAHYAAARGITIIFICDAPDLLPLIRERIHVVESFEEMKSELIAICKSERLHSDHS